MSRRRKPAFTIERVRLEVNDDGDKIVPEQAFVEIFELTIALQKEAGIFPLSFEKAAASVYRTLAQEMTLVARSKGGTVVGAIGFEETSSYYSDETMLWDKWFYVLPEHRGGAVGKALLRESTKLAEERGKIAMVTISNPDRQTKSPVRLARAAYDVGFIPRSYSLRLR